MDENVMELLKFVASGRYCKDDHPRMAVGQGWPAPCECLTKWAADIINPPDGFSQYRRSAIAELRPFVDGESLEGVSISPEDTKAGSPKAGDMIARNPKNHADKWLVAAQYFADNFEAA